MIPHAFITNQRAKVVRELPWVIPACILIFFGALRKKLSVEEKGGEDG